MIKSQSPPIAVRVYNENNRAVEKTISVGANRMASRAYMGKLIVLGESGVGKTQFSIGLQRAYETSYGDSVELPPEPQTIGTSFLVVPCQIDEETVFRAQLWDTAGQERFRSLMPMYMRDAHGAVVMFDVTHRASFEEAVNYWVEQVREHMMPDAPIILVGNKCDDTSRRTVTRAEAEATADGKHLLYAESTALITASLHGVLATIAANMYFYQVRQVCLSNILPPIAADFLYYQVRNRCLTSVQMPVEGSIVFNAVEKKTKKCCGGGGGGGGKQ